MEASNDLGTGSGFLAKYSFLIDFFLIYTEGMKKLSRKRAKFSQFWDHWRQGSHSHLT